LSTGAVTRDPVQTDHRAIVEHGPALGVSAFELGVYAAWYGHLDDVVSDLRDSGLRFPVVHAEKAIGAALGSAEPNDVDDAFQRLELNCRAAAAVGAKTLVLHLWERPSGDADLERNVKNLPDCLDTAAAYGLVLAVETIPGDVGTPLDNVRAAVERDTRCRVTLDTEFLGFHGQLDASIAADWLWRDNRVGHVHLKDFDGRLRDGGGRRYLLPGEGSLDLQSWLTGLVERGYGGAITLEANAVTSEGKLDAARLKEIAAVLQRLGAS
jgi:sugar phosphate isomerase/epimerase